MNGLVGKIKDISVMNGLIGIIRDISVMNGLIGIIRDISVMKGLIGIIRDMYITRRKSLPSFLFKCLFRVHYKLTHSLRLNYILVNFLNYQKFK